MEKLPMFVDLLDFCFGWLVVHERATVQSRLRFFQAFLFRFELRDLALQFLVLFLLHLLFLLH
jgi:hypothetical protein